VLKHINQRFKDILLIRNGSKRSMLLKCSLTIGHMVEDYMLCQNITFMSQLHKLLCQDLNSETMIKKIKRVKISLTEPETLLDQCITPLDCQALWNHIHSHQNFLLVRTQIQSTPIQPMSFHIKSTRELKDCPKTARISTLLFKWLQNGNSVPLIKQTAWQKNKRKSKLKNSKTKG